MIALGKLKVVKICSKKLKIFGKRAEESDLIVFSAF